MSSGLYDHLVDAGLMLSHQEVTLDRAMSAEAYKVVRPQRLDFVSYPYEWSFSQLRDAALVTLTIQKAAMQHGMSLRDASAYNIQFHRGRPVLIDTLSFEALREGEPWIAYRQFCQHFLAPLALMSYRSARLGRLSQLHIDGLPLDLTASLLPFRARLRLPLLLHLFFHAKGQKRLAAGSSADSANRKAFSSRAFHGLIESLESGVARLRPQRRGSQWVDYYQEASHYSQEALEHKKELVSELIEEVAPKDVWDLGANVGVFSRIASDRGINTVCFELDAAAVDENYRKVKERRETNVLPLVIDLLNPSPGIGWENQERMTLTERGPASLAMALALVHHLAIANNVPLPRVAKFLSELCGHLIIEFVPKGDEKVQEMLARRDDIFPEYTEEGFERAFEERFEIVRREGIKGSARALYLMAARR